MSPRTALIVTVALLASSCSLFRPSTIRRTELVFGIPCTVTLFERGFEEAVDLVFEEMRRLERMMSVHDEESVVSEINRRAGGEPLSVPEELYRVIEAGIAFGQVTGGAFDVSIGPVVALWDVGGEHPRVPTQGEIDEARGLVSYADILLLEYRRQVLLKRKGMRIDLGGIAKGYAADRAAEILRSEGVGRAIIDFGGNLYALGERVGGEAWRIGIQNPFEPRGNYLGILTVRDLSVVTSGIYERYFETGGARYHHLLDPATGYPVENGLAGVTVVANSSMTADALATALFVLGIEAGSTLVENFAGVEALFVTESKELYFSSGASKRFIATDESFRIVSRGGE